MIEQDGWETVYSSDEIVRTEPFIERDIRVAVARLRAENRASPPPAMVQVGFDGELHVKRVVPARITFPIGDCE